MYERKNSIVIKKNVRFVIALCFIILIYSGALYVIKNNSHELSQDILEYLKVLIWPLVILLIVYLFKSNIADLIGRIEEWEAPFIGKGKTHGVNPQQEIAKTFPRDEGKDFKMVIDAKEKEISALKDNEQELVDKLTRAQIELDFERIYNLIFASQIDLLLKVNAFGKVEFAYVLDHYSRAQQASASLLKDWTFSQYIKFWLITS
ncbi:MAG: hypothetical protein WC788_08520 [Candidatus Paceibacterota bacterium]